jgi:hypothetical protein
MAIKDILLPLVGEPDAAAIAAIDKRMAVADALALLEDATDVRIVTATDNKTQAEMESGAAISPNTESKRHLKR